MAQRAAWARTTDAAASPGKACPRATASRMQPVPHVTPNGRGVGRASERRQLRCAMSMRGGRADDLPERDLDGKLEALIGIGNARRLAEGNGQQLTAESRLARRHHA